MAVGCGTVVVPVASGRNLRAVFTASVFNGELELRRLAALRRCCELCAVAARIEQDGYTTNGQQSGVTNPRASSDVFGLKKKVSDKGVSGTMKLSGHKSIESFSGYLHLLDTATQMQQKS